MESLPSLLAAIQDLRAVPAVQWRSKVLRVAVILTSSRSGSTVFKSALASHPGIAALDGEMEPLLALTGNGYGHDPSCQSDAIAALRAVDALADNVFDGLSVAIERQAPRDELIDRWRKRLLLHFPALFTAPGAHEQLRRALADGFTTAFGGASAMSQEEAVRTVLHSVYRCAPWRLDYYDGRIGPGTAPPFAEPAKIEEPPFVLPGLQRRCCREADLATKVLLFKTPSDAYRPALYRQLFPHAEIRFLHLTRGFAQSVNGLIDGWLSPLGFFAHDMQRTGTTLAITGYSELRPFGQRWWKFDLPPNWRDFTQASLERVCLNQWLSCHRHILASGVATLRIAFEDFLRDPTATLARTFDWLELPPPPAAPALAVTMATEIPAAGRWRRRSAMLLPLAQQPEVADTMRQLGYRLQPETWQ